MTTRHCLWYKTRQHLLVKLGDPTMNPLTNGFLSGMCASHSFPTVIQVSYGGLCSPQQPLSVQEYSGFQGDSGLLSSLAEWLCNDKIHTGGVRPCSDASIPKWSGTQTLLLLNHLSVASEERKHSLLLNPSFLLKVKVEPFSVFNLSPLHNFFHTTV